MSKQIVSFASLRQSLTQDGLELQFFRPPPPNSWIYSVALHHYTSFSGLLKGSQVPPAVNQHRLARIWVYREED